MEGQNGLLTGEELDKIGMKKGGKERQAHRMLTRTLQAFGPDVYLSWKCGCGQMSQGIFKTEREANQNHLLHVAEVIEAKKKANVKNLRTYTASVKHTGVETVKCPGCLSRLESTYLTKRSLRWINERHKDAIADMERRKQYKQHEGEQEVPYEEISQQVAVVIAKFVKLEYKEALERWLRFPR